MKTVRERVDAIQEQISSLQKLLKREQEECSHPPEAVKKKHGVNAGNYLEPDYYWTDFECTLCDARWSEEGSK